MDTEKQTTNATTRSVEGDIPVPDAHVLPSSGVSEKDIEQATLHESLPRTKSRDSDKEQIEEPAGVEAAGPTACTVGQVGGDDFVEGGFEGWKVIFGCALIAAPTVGECPVKIPSFCSEIT